MKSQSGFKLVRLVIIMSLLGVSTAQARILISKSCSKNVKARISSFMTPLMGKLDEIAQEKYSYTETFNPFAAPGYHIVVEEFKIGLTSSELTNIRNVVYNKDVVVECPKMESPLCGTFKAGHAEVNGRWYNRNPRVVLCNTLLASFAWKCDLAQTLFHEIAHLADVEKSPNHNDGYERDDKVYSFGRAVGTACDAL